MNSIANHITSYIEKNGISSVGRLCVLLFVTNNLRGQSYPFDVERMLTENGGQISGLGGPSIIEILRHRNIHLPHSYIGEGGRTSRGAVGRARAYIEFLNHELRESSNREADLEAIEVQLSQILDSLYEKDARSIIAELPTKGDDYPGPRFFLFNDKIRLKEGRYAAEKDDVKFVDGIIKELRNCASGLVQRFNVNNNCYAGLLGSFVAYRDEIRRKRENINIFSICHLGFLVQSQVAALSNPKSEDPPLSAEQAAVVEAFMRFHFIFLINTDEGRKVLNSARALDEGDVGSDLTKFTQISIELVSRAAEEGVVDPKAAEFIKGSVQIAGTGDTPGRSKIFGIIVPRNFWSSFISNLLFESFKKSATGQEVILGLGIFVDAAVRFVAAHYEQLVAMARAIPEHFSWLEKFLNWFN